MSASDIRTISRRAASRSSRPTRWRSTSDQNHARVHSIASTSAPGSRAPISARRARHASRQQRATFPLSSRIVSSRSRRTARGSPLEHAIFVRRILWNGLSDVPQLHDPVSLESEDVSQGVPRLAGFHPHPAMNRDQVPFLDGAQYLELLLRVLCRVLLHGR